MQVLKLFASKKFKDPKLESLYQRYFFKLNQTSMTVLIGILCICCLINIIFYYIGGASLPITGAVLGVVIVTLLILEVSVQVDLWKQRLQQIVVVMCRLVEGTSP